MQWPEDIDRRLNILVRAATAAGERTSRAELLAALVAAADTQPEQLALLLHRYRRLPETALSDDESREDLPKVRSRPPTRRIRLNDPRHGRSPRPAGTTATQASGAGRRCRGYPRWVVLEPGKLRQACEATPAVTLPQGAAKTTGAAAEPPAICSSAGNEDRLPSVDRKVSPPARGSGPKTSQPSE